MNSTRTRTKICGITRVEDAIAAGNAGADAVGLVFYSPSPRYVSIDLAKEIVARIPPFINVVGLFVDAEQEYVEKVLQQVSIDTLQFHGQEPEQACALYNKPYIKAIRMQENSDIQGIIDAYPSANAFLLDTYIKDIPGGTGVAFDWERFPKKSTKPLILAGGLTPENVQSAIEKTRPYAVDVSGGVELDKGIKDINKVTKFIREALYA